MAAVSRIFKILYNKAFHGIGFLPGAMAVLFVVLAIAMLELDQRGFGDELNRQFKWLTLKDAATANSILSTVTTGIISLTVFSFSLVMIVMAQAASHMSNRMLDTIIGDKTQKTILGFYTGTLVYTLFIFTTVSEAEAGQVPTISIYFLLLLMVIDIFLFIYFLNHITEAFRFEQQIKRIQNMAISTLNRLEAQKHVITAHPPDNEGKLVACRQTNYYQGFDRLALLNIACKNDLVIEILNPIGTHLLRGMPVLKYNGKTINDETLIQHLDFYHSQEIDKNVYYGFFHLTEVAVKALSPGINDPGTAVLAVNALTDLFARIIQTPIRNALCDDNGTIRIFTRQYALEELFDACVLPIYDYGKNDRLTSAALRKMLEQLLLIKGSHHDFMRKWLLTFKQKGEQSGN